MGKILILTDYRGAFYSTFSSRNSTLSMNVEFLAERLLIRGYETEICSFSQLDLEKQYAGIHVLYTSSEDDGLLYKSYIEDIILYLEEIGAKLLPPYKFLRAHHNKAMMELLRYQLFPDSARRMGTKVLGALEELKLIKHKMPQSWPKVVKSAYGAGSGLVGSARDESALLNLVKSYSRSTNYFLTELKEIIKVKLRPYYQRRSTHRLKYVVQEMIPGLQGDFKVLCMGRRYYCLYRKNRENDFRASGSGLFNWNIEEVIDESSLLGYAEQVYKTLDTPIASLDIGFDGTDFHLIEFQILYFGTLTAENSKYYYSNNMGRWDKVKEACVIEEVLADAVDFYIKRS